VKLKVNNFIDNFVFMYYSIVTMKINRCIKFRVWFEKEKRWLHGPSDRNDLDGINILGETILLGGFLDGVSIQDLNEIDVLQFTGLQDKNGCDIFEGDIINGYLCIDEIGSGGYTNSNEWDFTDKVTFAGCGFYCEKADFPIDQYETLEIIGNIYDNPELLK